MSVRRRRLPPTTPPTAERTPVRLCVGCRQHDVQVALLRVVAVGAAAATTSSWAVEPDPRRRSRGRGAYVHPDLGCLRLAEQRRAFQRALRRRNPPDTGPLHRWLEQLQA